jgi:spore coat protein CotH
MRNTILLIATLLLVGASVADAQSPDDLFDSRTLQEVRLYIHSSDLAQLRERYLEDTYYPADFEWRGIRARISACACGGSRTAARSSRASESISTVRRPADLSRHERLVLDNALKDPSMIRERTSMAFIKRMGQPAPRESFAVCSSTALEGVYALVEVFDARFLAQALGDGLGYLFEHKYVNGFHAEDLGDGLEAYKLRFAAATHRLEGDYTLYAPIRELFREVNQPVDGVWRERVAVVHRSQQLVTYVAIETFLAEFDGFLGESGMAKLLPLPSGGDQRAPVDRRGTGTRLPGRSRRRSSRALTRTRSSSAR